MLLSLLLLFPLLLPLSLLLLLSPLLLVDVEDPLRILRWLLLFLRRLSLFVLLLL